MTDLSAYASLSKRVAAQELDQEWLIKATDFPDSFRETQPFRETIIDTSYQRFIGSPGEGEDRPFEVMDQSKGFELYIEPDPLRRLGFWLLHLLFSGRDWAGLNLTHPMSRSKWLYVELVDPQRPNGFLQVEAPLKFSAYEHWPQQVQRHAFAEPAMAGIERVGVEDRPLFAFGWSDPDWNGLNTPGTSDQLIWQLTPQGLCALASLFFDMTHPTLGTPEVNMEPPFVGFAATHPRSIEARFWLPGSLAFYSDRLDDLTLPPARAV